MRKSDARPKVLQACRVLTDSPKGGASYADIQAMTGLSQGTARSIAAKFPWKRYRSFADIGCAQGGVAVEIALAQVHADNLRLAVRAARVLEGELANPDAAIDERDGPLLARTSVRTRTRAPRRRAMAASTAGPLPAW